LGFLGNSPGAAHFSEEQAIAAETGQQFSKGDMPQQGHGGQDQPAIDRGLSDGQGTIEL
jgi:hypothetical protein